MSRPIRRLAIATALVAALAAPAAALAGNVHLKGGVKPNPAFTDNGLTLTATVSYAGLGNFDTQQNVDARANPTASCTNPAGQTQPPGQNPAEADVTGSTTVPAAKLKNGNVTIATTTNAPATPIFGAPDCPNPQWTESITDMAFTSATITVRQDTDGDGLYTDESVLLTVTCTFSPPTVNGAVSASRYSCTS